MPDSKLPHTACLVEWLTVTSQTCAGSLSDWPCVCSHLVSGRQVGNTHRLAKEEAVGRAEWRARVADKICVTSFRGKYSFATSDERHACSYLHCRSVPSQCNGVLISARVEFLRVLAHSLRWHQPNVTGTRKNSGLQTRIPLTFKQPLANNPHWVKEYQMS